MCRFLLLSFCVLSVGCQTTKRSRHDRVTYRINTSDEISATAADVMLDITTQIVVPLVVQAITKR